MFDLLLFFPKNHNLWLFSIWSFVKNTIYCTLDPFIGSNPGIDIENIIIHSGPHIKLVWRTWESSHFSFTPWQKLHWLPCKTHVKQLGAAFKETQMRPHILVGPLTVNNGFAFTKQLILAVTTKRGSYHAAKRLDAEREVECLKKT